MQNFFLIGYMGSGKTIIGKCLAAKLNMKWVDIDYLIETRYKKSIMEIFTREGEKSFRNKERKILQEVVLWKNIVFSTGGGTPCFFDNIKIMNKTGIVIYLKTSAKILSDRLYKVKQTRPLIANKNKREIQNFVAKNLLKRELFYNQATIVFPVFLSEIETDSIVEYLYSKIEIHQAL